MNNLFVSIELTVTSTMSQEELQAQADQAVETLSKACQLVHVEEPFVYVDTWY